MSKRIVVILFALLGTCDPLFAGAAQRVPDGEVVTPDGQLTNDKQLAAKADRLLDRGHYDELIQIYTALLERYPDAGMLFANRAMAYLMTNRLDEGRADLAAATAAIPDHAIIERIRGLIAIRLSDDKTALIHLTKSLEKEAGNPFALRMRAYIHQRSGEEQLAINDAEAYIKARPNDADADVLKANLLIGQKKRGLALAEADRLFSKFAGNAYGISAAARVYDGLGNRQRALELINQAIGLDPELFYYRQLRANFRRWDDFAGRREDLEAALAADPNNTNIINQIGLLEFRQHRWREAVGQFSRVLAVEPRDFGVLAYRAMAYLQAGDGNAAAKDYDAALRSSSGADDFNTVCWALGREGLTLGWALEACNRAISLKDRDGRFRANRGLVKFRMGRFDEALVDFNLAIEADDRRAASYYGRALLHHRIAEYEMAMSDLQQALVIEPQIAEEYEQYGFVEPAQRP